MQRQRSRLEQRQLELARLEPRYQELLRDRPVLESQLQLLSEREGEERLIREVSRSELENVQILEPARPPSQGKSMKLIVAAAGVVFGGFTGLMFALIWLFTKTTLSTAGSASRTVGLPVLASVRRV